MSELSRQFYAYMNRIPKGEYATKRNALMAHMGWSYWAYCRRLHGNVYLTKNTRDRIEQFFNEKIFE